MNLIEAAKDMLTTKKIGDVTIKKPFFMSKKNLAVLIVPILAIANRKWNLGLENQDLMAIAIVVAGYLGSQAWEDAAVKTAAINKGDE